MLTKTVTKEAFINAAGTKLESSQWYEINQERIDTFAECTEDHQFIHVDKEKAKHAPYGGTIAHGFLTLSMLSKMAEKCFLVPENFVMSINYGFDKIRFLSPVRAGKRVRMHAEILSVNTKDDKRFLTKMAVSVEIEGEETPALIAEWLYMSFIG